VFITIVEYFLILCQVRFQWQFSVFAHCEKGKASSRRLTKAKKVDKFFLIMSPFAFALFILVYWSANGKLL